MPKKIVGIVLIVIGIIMITYTGFQYVTTEKVVDLGPIQINKEKDHNIKWSPVIGIVLIFGGIVIVANNKNARV